MNKKISTAGILGTIVTWKVPTQVPFTVLQQALTDSGLDPDLSKELAPYYALCRALSDMKKGRVIRKLRRDGLMVHFQLTKELVEPDVAIYSKETELAINTQTGEIECDNKYIKREARKLLEEHQANRTASDITYLLFRIYKIHAADLIAIREQGGAYFVPNEFIQLVQQTRQLLDAIGGKLRTFEIRLGSDDTANSVAESMSDYFEGLVEQFKETCEGITSETGTAVQTRRWDEVSALRQKMELYRGLLSGYADHIGDEIGEAEKRLMAKLAGS